MAFLFGKLLFFFFQFVLFNLITLRLLIQNCVLAFAVVAAMEALAGLNLQLGQVSCDQ